jgi:hypothetical protein
MVLETKMMMITSRVMVPEQLAVEKRVKEQTRVAMMRTETRKMIMKT